MMRILKIQKIKPFYFRVFGDSPSITINDRLTIFYGPNGSGKSSLTEAIEWLLFGTTKRRLKGEHYSKREYKDSYINKNCPKGSAPFVEAEILVEEGGSVHTIKREMEISASGQVLDNSSIMYFDGKQIGDVMEFATSNSPIIAQHGIQDFIHTKPIQRYRIISEALGLADLIAFKDSLEKAKNRYRSNCLPHEISHAHTTVNRLTRELGKLNFSEEPNLSSLSDVASNWAQKKINVEADYNAIFEYLGQLTGKIPHNINEALQEAKKYQATEMNKVFDMTPFRSSVDVNKFLQQIDTSLQDNQELHNKFVKAISAFVESSASHHLSVSLKFWRLGLDILDKNKSLPNSSDIAECPFCEEDTITLKLVGGLEKRLIDGRKLSESRQHLKNVMSDHRSSLTQFKNKLHLIKHRRLSEKDACKLKSVFAEDIEQIDLMVTRNHLNVKTIGDLSQKLNEVDKNLIIIEQRIDQIIDLQSTLVSVKGIFTEMEELFEKVRVSVQSYAKLCSTFVPILERELSDEKTVTKYTIIIDLLNYFDQVEIAEKAIKFDARIVEAQSVADEYILQQQKNVLAVQEADILKWYGCLSPSTDVVFSGLQPSRNAIALKATAFGNKLNAAASLSQSQLNCLGLSLYIPCVTASDSPFDFIIFDDPVQAMDDDHHESFTQQVVPKLLESENLQVIVFTHMRSTADRIRDMNYHSDYNYLRFDELCADGPKILDHIILKDELKSINDMKNGNEQFRILAKDRIRTLCEHIIREAILKHTSTPLDPLINTAGPMLKEFQKLSSVNVHTYNKLKNTVNWSNPAHHTPRGDAPPAPDHISSHHGNLKKIIKDLELL